MGALSQRTKLPAPPVCTLPVFLGCREPPASPRLSQMMFDVTKDSECGHTHPGPQRQCGPPHHSICRWQGVESRTGRPVSPAGPRSATRMPPLAVTGCVAQPLACSRDEGAPPSSRVQVTSDSGYTADVRHSPEPLSPPGPPVLMVLTEAEGAQGSHLRKVSAWGWGATRQQDLEGQTPAARRSLAALGRLATSRHRAAGLLAREAPPRPLPAPWASQEQWQVPGGAPGKCHRPIS